MGKTIYSKFDKNAIQTLPRVLFDGEIIEVSTEEAADEAVRRLLSEPILGVDTETRPVFKKGVSRKVALLQVSTLEVCYLFRLNVIGITDSIKTLLEDKKVPKIGLSLHDDMNMLHKRADFDAGNFIDLQNVVGKFGIKDLSLQKLYANLFHQKISKRQRLTNWELVPLNDKQRGYAATDAWACIMIYNELKRLSESKDYNLVVVPEKVDEQPDVEKKIKTDD